MTVLYLTYISLGILVLFCAARFVRFATMPLHLRWELYPVPHEKGKEYGGSYFEEVDWWTRPRHKSHLGPILFMIPEIFFLRALYHENRSLWRSSFPFHLALYFYVAWVVLLIIGAILGLTAGEGALLGVATTLTVIAGAAAFVIGVLGTLALLLQRLTSRQLKPFTTFKDVFNLIFILALFVTGLLAWLGTGGLRFEACFAFVTGALTAEAPAITHGLVTTHVLVLCAFMIYFPFTHMTHAFTKWFMWDKVRWADTPNLRGSKIESQVRQVLSYPVTWRAAHIQGEGRSWAEVATDDIESSE